MSTLTSPLKGFTVRQLAFEWPRTLWVNLVVAVFVGGLYSLSVMGPGPINPRNIDWLTFDGAQHQIAWELFRQDPKLHWPITFSDRIGVPMGESISLLDPDPLIAVLLKPISPILPEPFQYQGIEVVLVCILQFYFALLLFRTLLGSNPFAVVLPSLFFLIAPPLTWRFQGHYALSNHWLLIATLVALCFTRRDASADASRRFVIYAVLLAGTAVAINPYIALQVLVLLTGGVASLVWQRRLSPWRAAGVMTAIGAACFVVAAAFGLFISGGRGYAAGGYRAYSLNGLALIDPQAYHAILLKSLPRIGEQYEGYNYFGLGAILLLIVAFWRVRSSVRLEPATWGSTPVVSLRRYKIPDRDYPTLLCLFAGCVVLTALALSTKVTFGSMTLIDLDPKERFTPYLAALRASGRLFWTPYYVLLGAVFLTIFWTFRKRWAIILTCFALATQWADTRGLRRFIHSETNQTHPSPLRSPAWSKLGKYYKNLMIMPAWQCSGDTPGGLDGFRTFGFLAAAQHMGINSYYAARYTEVNREVQCGKAISDLATKPISADSAYVVTPFLAQQIGEGPTGPGKCYAADKFILCSLQTNFGLSPATPAEQLEHAIDDAGFEDTDLLAWPSYGDPQAVVSNVRAHGGLRSLAETGAGSVYQDVMGLKAGHTYRVAGWVSGTSDATATARIATYDPGANIATFSNDVHPEPSWQLVTHSITVSARGTIRIHLSRNEGSGTVFWDDVRIYLER
jgi:hypothetical protein